MKKKLAILLMISIFAVSCENADDALSDVNLSDNFDANGDWTYAFNDGDPGVPSLALSFETNVDYLSGFNYSDEVKYDKAVDLVKKVVATEAFKSQVLNHTYNGSKSFANNNGLSNKQIYQTILDAAERLTPSKNNTMDVGVKLYYSNNSVVGWTSTSITYINVNTKFFDQYAVNSVAGNLFHEWLHKLGYGHDSTATARRPYSVPYAIGYMIRDIGKNFL